MTNVKKKLVNDDPNIREAKIRKLKNKTKTKNKSKLFQLGSEAMYPSYISKGT